MVALYIIIALETILLIWLASSRFSRGGGKALTSGHELVKVYYKSTGYSYNSGWVWKCSCGTGFMLDDYGNPTEECALAGWKKHKALYSQMAVESGENKYKTLYEDTKSELEKFKEACYCKDLK